MDTAHEISSAAILVIDMQKFFFVENQDVNEKELAANCSDILQFSRERNIPVIHVTTAYRQDQVDWPRAWRTSDSDKAADVWCANLVSDHELAEDVDGLAAQPGDFIVHKKRFSAFYNTNLDDILRNIGATEIFVIGYSADVCLRFTSVDAYNRGYQITLIDDGIESFKESKADAIAYLNWTIDARCISFEEFRKERPAG